MATKFPVAIIISYLPVAKENEPAISFDQEEELTLIEIDVLKRDIKHSLLRIKTVREEQVQREKMRNESGKTVRK